MHRLSALALLAAACGAPSAPVITSALASVGGVEVRWEAHPGATYRVQLRDLDGRAAVGPVRTVVGGAVHLEGVASGVSVEAVGRGRALGAVTQQGQGDGSAWQLFAPGETTADFTLAAGERLGVLLIDADGSEGAQARVEIDGVASAPAPAPQRTALHALQPLSAHAPEQPVSTALAQAEPRPLAEHDSFCVVRALDFSHHYRKSFTLRAQTAHAAIYVDDEDDPTPAAALADAYESRVLPSSLPLFGAATDVDQNGRVLVLITHELGAHLNGGWLIGYFGNADLLRARDTTPGCSDGGSNHGEVLYLNSLSNGRANGYGDDLLLREVFPATVAHELQHLVNLGHRCVEQACDGAQATWLNEGLSKVAEDAAGYGWNTGQGRFEGGQYLADIEARSLTHWEGDPIGNYQGAHSFVRFFADRYGQSMAAALQQQGSVEDALQMPLLRAMAEWGTALLVSNEPGAPYNYEGAGWSPLHARLGNVDAHAPGETVNLRQGGIAAYLSGPSAGGAAQVRIHAPGVHAVVVRVR